MSNNLNANEVEIVDLDNALETMLEREFNYFKKGLKKLPKGKIIDNKGNSMLEINDGSGTYILVSSNPVTGEYSANTIVVLSNILFL